MASCSHHVWFSYSWKKNIFFLWSLSNSISTRKLPTTFLGFIGNTTGKNKQSAAFSRRTSHGVFINQFKLGFTYSCSDLCHVLASLHLLCVGSWFVIYQIYAFLKAFSIKIKRHFFFLAAATASRALGLPLMVESQIALNFDIETSIRRTNFPSDFLFGASTAALQVSCSCLYLYT